MRNPIWTPALGLALLATLACGDGTGPDPLADFDAAALETALAAALAPAGGLGSAQFALESAWADLAGSHGVQFAPRTAVARSPRAQRLGLDDTVLGTGLFRTAVFIPEAIRGRTFVYDPAEEVWVIDEGRAGAPAEGIRVIYYATTSTGFALPLNELGTIDLTDQDTESLSRLGTRIVRADGPLTLADFVQGYRFSDSEAGYSDHFEADGFIRDGSGQLDFELASDYAEAAASGDETYSIDLSVAADRLDYIWGFIGETRGATGLYVDEFTISIDHADATTLLEFAATGQLGSGDESVTGTLEHRGAHVADIAFLATGNVSAVKPDGSAFPNQERNAIESLVLSMFYSGISVLFTVPVLFFS